MPSHHNDGQREIAHWEDVPRSIRRDAERFIEHIGGQARRLGGELSLDGFRDQFDLAISETVARLEKRLERAMAKHHPELDVLP